MNSLHATIHEAAALLGVYPSTARRYVVDGKLTAAPRMGRRHRVTLESLAYALGLSVDETRKLVQKLRDAEQSQSAAGLIANNTTTLVAAGA